MSTGAKTGFICGNSGSSTIYHPNLGAINQYITDYFFLIPCTRHSDL
ncbi:hypothetical protein CORMATOL_01394 [Corynebacterium matruchotii ATCC 33806]|uniref:Uncharacterized protein n=1 Tax=Corynebacterium matruchotii ATCC 33806 TaxID=566549 RepID=C0E332_9CORY|nr:hypothetical protein CORMATOL_01394 [Corynebacterium matruchotii ATCC 33806]